MELPAQFCGISYIWDFQSVLFWFSWLSVASFPNYEGQGNKNERGARNSVQLSYYLKLFVWLVQTGKDRPKKKREAELDLPCRHRQDAWCLLHITYCL